MYVGGVLHREEKQFLQSIHLCLVILGTRGSDVRVLCGLAIELPFGLFPIRELWLARRLPSLQPIGGKHRKIDFDHKQYTETLHIDRAHGTSAGEEHGYTEPIFDSTLPHSLFEIG